MDPIYRRSKQGIYWIYNLKSKDLQKLTDEKVQEPTFSPDGKNVAYVYRRNIYVKNLVTKATRQLTFDGDYQIINGITDWVYEEEFGFVRAFHWSPDSKKIVFMRFDESKVPIFSMGIYGKDTYPFPYMFRYPLYISIAPFILITSNKKNITYLISLRLRMIRPIDLQ